MGTTKMTGGKIFPPPEFNNINKIADKFTKLIIEKAKETLKQNKILATRKINP